MRRLIRWFLILGGITVVLAGIGVPLSTWWQHRSAPKFTTAQISKGRIETVVNSTGTVKPVRSVSVGAFVSGPIAEINVDFNSVVKKDDLLARIDPRLWQAAVDRDRAQLSTQKAELSRVEALLQQAKNNEERARKLAAVNKEYLSGTEMDQYVYTRITLEAQVELAKASILQAEATLKNSEANLSYTEIRSPVDGMVIERKVDPGQTVAASFQTPEMFIVAPDMEKHMYVFASVDEADIGLIRTAQERGKEVKFTVDAYPGDLFPGKIFQIRKAATTTQNVVTYPVVIEAANPDLKLMPGMTANISFQIEGKEGVLRVPMAALRFVPPVHLVRPEDKHFIETPVSEQESAPQRSATEKSDLALKRRKRVLWLVEGEQLKAAKVTLGLSENQFAEIVGGDLSDGQAVVTGVEGTAVK
ncbi:MAG: efflux RND transporter periplasmic adaptor subunit [Gemmataceae bacterium]